ncbi:hypothetical protein [Streptomyces sp. NPDC006879]|uniref:hypothetical protein n=1 Tax=Streptomyces sp. NPDC006879 TaxID=3364767 RepID=UPI0036B87A5A
MGAILLFLAVAAGAGAFSRFWAFLDFGAGVLALVSLTSTVLWGLAATDRLFLHSAQRLLAQGVHRGLAVSGLGFLALHITVKVADNRTSAAAAAVPFTDIEQPLLIGLGTLAGYLFLAVAVTGAVRSAFASGGSSSRLRSLSWRALHMGAYPAWGAALVHGLKSGRSADSWVTVGYALALVGVAVALALRTFPLGGSTAGATARIPIPAQRTGPRAAGPRPAAPPSGQWAQPSRPEPSGPQQPEPLGATRGWGP